MCVGNLPGGQGQGQNPIFNPTPPVKQGSNEELDKIIQEDENHRRRTRSLFLEGNWGEDAKDKKK